MQLLTDIESLAAKYVASLGKMNFFSNPTVRKLFSEGRPGVKFEFQHGDRK